MQHTHAFTFSHFVSLVLAALLFTPFTVIAQEVPAPTEPPQEAPPTTPAPVIERAFLLSYEKNSGNTPGEDRYYWVALPATTPAETAAWDDGIVYASGAVVTANGTSFASNIDSNSGNHPLQSDRYVRSGEAWIAQGQVPAWQEGGYEEGDLVTYQGVVYRRTATASGTQAHPTDEAVVTEGEAAAWDSSVAYSEGATVTFNGAQYQSTVSANAGYQPAADRAYVRGVGGMWTLVGDVNEWVADTTYDEGAIVRKNGVVYTSLTAANSGNDPSAPVADTYYLRDDGSTVLLNAVSPWDEGTPYVIGDLAAVGGVVYRATAESTGAAPAENTDSWHEVAGQTARWGVVPHTALWRTVVPVRPWVKVSLVTPWSKLATPEASWDAAATYQYGDIVTHNGTRYFSANAAAYNPRYARADEHVVAVILFSEEVRAVPTSLTLNGIVVRPTVVTAAGKTRLTASHVVQATDVEKTLAAADIALSYSTEDGGVVRTVPSLAETVTIDMTAPRITDSLFTDGILRESSYTYPSYTFTASESGIAHIGGDCAATRQEAVVGRNTITFSLARGERRCSVSVRDAAGNVSSTYTTPSFVIDTPEGVFLQKPEETFSVNKKRARVSFTIELDHWFAADATESVASVSIEGCGHFDDRLRSKGRFFVKRTGDELFTASAHTVRTKDLNDGTYEGCSLVVNDSDPVPIKPFTVVGKVPEEVRGPNLPGSSSPDEHIPSESSGMQGTGTRKGSTKPTIKAPVFLP